jgi:NAD(P)-dependent dehydrogenase (short-subunit alcohol dehydrogenase family)
MTEEPKAGSVARRPNHWRDATEQGGGPATTDSCNRESVWPTDIMVNNAGIETRTSVLDTTEQQYEKVLQVNLKSAFSEPSLRPSR